ncbi:MAG: putative ORFan [Harvfovirus sp.]|uniref:Putative ORFan n=1 Tax=Harvfovirus sp. TaxID=2487768 RepID=A0A3G5A4E9_9VIRU|nr:MAG: putative ORFan [Harvfovirus sp.]
MSDDIDCLLIKYFSKDQVKAFKKSKLYQKYVKIFKLMLDKNNARQVGDMERIFEMLGYYSKIDAMFDIHEYFRMFLFRFFRNVFYEESYFHIVIYCQKSWGFGDVMFGVKNKFIADKFYPEDSIFLVVRTAADGKLIRDSLVKEEKAAQIYTLEQYITLCKQSEKMSSCHKQIYVGAVGANMKRFNDIPGKKIVVFLDEYNGWRIGIDENAPIQSQLGEKKEIFRYCDSKFESMESKFEIRSKYIINQSQIWKDVFITINRDPGFVIIDYVSEKGHDEKFICSLRGKRILRDLYVTIYLDITKIITNGLFLRVAEFSLEVNLYFLKFISMGRGREFCHEERRYIFNPNYEILVIMKRLDGGVDDVDDLVPEGDRHRSRELKTVGDICLAKMRNQLEVCSCRECIGAEHNLSSLISKSACHIKDEKWVYDDLILAIVGSAGIGLNQKKYPCMGIHLGIKLPDRVYDKKLISYLKFLPTTKFYFAYNSDSAENNYSYLIKFIETICLSRWDPDRWIDIMIISRDCYLVPDNTIEYEDIILHEYQKIKLRIFINESISHDDMIYMMAISQELIFVSGDQSFAEVIALYQLGIVKILFYQVQSWKMDLVKEYRNLVCHILKDKAPILLKFVDLVFSKTATSTTLINLIKEEKVVLIHQSGILYKKIIEIFNLEDGLVSLINSINMRLFFCKHPLGDLFFL